METPYGYCECGCGGLAPIAKQTDTNKGCKKGEPRRFIQGHATKLKSGKDTPNYKGGHTRSSHGYGLILMPGHPRANRSGHVYEHVLLAEKALGKPLPAGAHVHHHTPEQLVICQDNAYHMFLHQRQRALKACGHASWLKCRFCGQHDDPLKMYVAPNGRGHHRECANNYSNQRKSRV